MFLTYVIKVDKREELRLNFQHIYVSFLMPQKFGSYPLDYILSILMCCCCFRVFQENNPNAVKVKKGIRMFKMMEKKIMTKVSRSLGLPG